MDILKAEHISKQYQDHIALNDFSLSIPKNSIFGLLGPNGAGKSTFIRIITQIIMSDSGKIWFDGEELKPEHISQIGYLPEERGLYKKMKVGEQLLYLAQLKGMKKSEATRKVKHWLEKFEIAQWWSKNIEDLSKGMQQKIQFIATVLHDPKLIILDEPFTGFDPINARLIKKEIIKLRDKGASIIFSTHRMESVEELCDHLALIYKSRKILDGRKDDIKADYKNNTYVVEHIGELSNLDARLEILESKIKDDDRHVTRIKLSRDESPNELLKYLIEKTEIHGFKELLPSINDIFISKINEVKNEQNLANHTA
ncbi:ABC transporter ATP-binding protein [Aureibacter tunicatorum]|uniref:ABC-2 type transport system ATP-binding protein n=1 Tax=Aureibacter tunicatorum TaxID=866807 RepID=A0AAE3XKX2_9BACT|nr:ATP-binding cassette domain-containing protein [Aureibacter tunicatorum]MDR6237884.1 ABC-2 type transport system ATP-binding protein [Aureibacter tunicatorum]BDD02919.1 ABC transporter ATP-binding protein [Aureibacter tunicatorum]